MPLPNQDVDAVQTSAESRSTALNPRHARSTRDLAVFLQWLKDPKRTGAVAASGTKLAESMARQTDPDVPGQLIEFGPGTGPVTKALVARGYDARRLFLIEPNADFRAGLAARLPEATTIDGDAFAIRALVKAHRLSEISAIVSSLPLLNWPASKRAALLDDSLSVLPAGAPFVQFTYGPIAPIPVSSGNIKVARSGRVWLNLPPATVWTYRKS